VPAKAAGATRNISYRSLQPIVDMRFGRRDIGFVLANAVAKALSGSPRWVARLRGKPL